MLISTWRQTAYVCCLLLVIAGGWLLGDGLWIKAKAQLAQWLIASAWSASTSATTASFDHQIPRPWPWADTWPVARLQVPRLKVEQYVMSGVDGEALAFGPGMNSAGSIAEGWMIAGHKDTHFAYLQDLQPGDLLRLTLGNGAVYEFSVSAIGVIDLGDSGSELQVGGDELVLVTCYPFGLSRSNPRLRYLVTAQLQPTKQLSPAGGGGGDMIAGQSLSAEYAELVGWSPQRGVSM